MFSGDVKMETDEFPVEDCEYSDNTTRNGTMDIEVVVIIVVELDYPRLEK